MKKSRKDPGNQPELSEHAKARIQQRGISLAALYALYKYGTWKHSRGAYNVSMDKKSHREAKKEMGQQAYAKVAHNLGIYMILSAQDMSVITVAHRKRRFRKK